MIFATVAGCSPAVIRLLLKVDFHHLLAPFFVILVVAISIAVREFGRDSNIDRPNFPLILRLNRFTHSKQTTLSAGSRICVRTPSPSAQLKTMTKQATSAINTNGQLEDPVSLFDDEGAERHRKRLKLDPAILREYRNHFCKHFRDSAAANPLLANRIRPHTLAVHQRCDSKIDGATKLLFKNCDGLLLESVILRFETGRTSLCVSSQVGCAAACSFCATGKMGVARNLISAEILDQVLQSGQIVREQGRKIRNVVFMGMGEPLHNEAALLAAIDALCSAEYFNMPPSRILVSSVGVVDGMLRLAERFPRVHQALSLHSVRQEVRAKLIPLAKKFTLDELSDTIHRLNQLQDCPVLLEYLLLDRVNDSANDARQLVKWVQGMNVHVNLIPYNAIDGADALRRSHRQQPFSDQVKASGLKVTTRHSLGHDIAAACGQLVQSENRRIARELHQLETPAETYSFAARQTTSTVKCVIAPENDRKRHR